MGVFTRNVSYLMELILIQNMYLLRRIFLREHCRILIIALQFQNHDFSLWKYMLYFITQFQEKPATNQNTRESWQQRTSRVR